MARPTKKELEQQVSKLNKQLAQYESEKKSARFSKGKAIVKWFCFALACAVIVTANLSFYSARVLIEPAKFNQITIDLLAQPAVQTAVAEKTTQAIFENVDTEQILIDVLPPRADVVAPVLSAQIKKFTLDKSKEILASPDFQQKSANVINTVHTTFIEGVRNYEGDGTINVSDIYTNLSSQLQNTKLSPVLGKQLPPNIGELQVFEASWLPTLHNLVTKLDTLRLLCAGLFFGLMGVFIWLSTNRRRALIQIGLAIALLGLATILALNVAKSLVVGSAVHFPEATGQIWTVITGPLVSQTIGAMVLGLAIAVVAWLGGSTKRAKQLRAKLSILLSGRLHQALFSKENKLTTWVGHRRKFLQLSLGVSFIIVCGLITISLSSIISVVLVFTLLSLAVETIASPGQKSRARR